jgi:hypothetical protein
MTKTSILVALALVASPLASRGGATEEPASTIRLEYLNSFNWPRSSRDKVKELSGLAYDPIARRLLAIVDDGEPARFYRFDVELSADRFEVKNPERVNISSSDSDLLDSEGIAISDGDVYISVEGRDKVTSDKRSWFRRRPSLIKLSNSGQILGEIQLPDAFRRGVTLREDQPQVGARDNVSLESLSVSPDGSEMFTGLEEPLIEDGLPADFGAGAIVRLIRLRKEGQSFVPESQYAYPIDAIPNPDEAKRKAPRDRNTINGLAEMLAVGRGKLLTLERSYVGAKDYPPTRTRIRIYEIDVSSAVDVSNISSLHGLSKAKVLEKRLVLDMDTIRDKLSPPKLDNFEGMSFGPSFEGKPTLILVSDDNGSPEQRTAFVALKVYGLVDFSRGSEVVPRK